MKPTMNASIMVSQIISYAYSIFVDIGAQMRKRHLLKNASILQLTTFK